MPTRTPKPLAPGVASDYSRLNPKDSRKLYINNLTGDTITYRDYLKLKDISDTGNRRFKTYDEAVAFQDKLKEKHGRKVVNFIKARGKATEDYGDGAMMWRSLTPLSFPESDFSELGRTREHDIFQPGTITQYVVTWKPA